MKLNELLAKLDPDQKVDFWKLAEFLGFDKAKSDMHDATLPWINSTKPACIDRLSKNKKMNGASQLMLVMQEVYKVENYSKEVMTLNGYKEGLKHELTAWRAGGGEYDPKFYTRAWTSFTLSESRVKTFSEYDGTYATRNFRLDKRSGAHWIVELKIKIEDVLLYLPHGQDDEIIVPVKIAEQAKVIKQT